LVNPEAVGILTQAEISRKWARTGLASADVWYLSPGSRTVADR